MHSSHMRREGARPEASNEGCSAPTDENNADHGTADQPSLPLPTLGGAFGSPKTDSSGRQHFEGCCFRWKFVKFDCGVRSSSRIMEILQESPGNHRFRFDDPQRYPPITGALPRTRSAGHPMVRVYSRCHLMSKAEVPCHEKGSFVVSLIGDLFLLLAHRQRANQDQDSHRGGYAFSRLRSRFCGVSGHVRAVH